MELALTLDALKECVKDKYDYDEKRIVGIMLARYDISLTKNIINDCYKYWHHNTGRNLDIFWAGYGAYLYAGEQTETKIIMDFPRNSNQAYFDLEAFISIKNELNGMFKKEYKDHIQLAFVNYSNGNLRFEHAIQIDLEKNLDENYGTIRELVEWITNECRSTHDVVALMMKLKQKKVLDTIKGITLTDAVNTALSALGLFL